MWVIFDKIAKDLREKCHVVFETCLTAFIIRKRSQKNKMRRVFVLVHHCMVLRVAGLRIRTFVVELGPAALSNADL